MKQYMGTKTINSFPGYTFEYSEKDKNDSFYLKLTKKQVKGKSIETIKNKKIESDIMDSFTYVKTLDKCTITVYNDGKYACISEYDNGGKKIFSFKDKVYTFKCRGQNINEISVNARDPLST